MARPAVLGPAVLLGALDGAAGTLVEGVVYPLQWMLGTQNQASCMQVCQEQFVPATYCNKVFQLHTEEALQQVAASFVPNPCQSYKMLAENEEIDHPEEAAFLNFDGTCMFFNMKEGDCSQEKKDPSVRLICPCQAMPDDLAQFAHLKETPKPTKPPPSWVALAVSGFNVDTLNSDPGRVKIIQDAIKSGVAYEKDGSTPAEVPIELYRGQKGEFIIKAGLQQEDGQVLASPQTVVDHLKAAGEVDHAENIILSDVAIQALPPESDWVAFQVSASGIRAIAPDLPPQEDPQAAAAKAGASAGDVHMPPTTTTPVPPESGDVALPPSMPAQGGSAAATLAGAGDAAMPEAPPSAGDVALPGAGTAAMPPPRMALDGGFGPRKYKRPSHSSQAPPTVGLSAANHVEVVRDAVAQPAGSFQAKVVGSVAAVGGVALMVLMVASAHRVWKSRPIEEAKALVQEEA